MTTDPYTGAATIVGLSVVAKPAVDLVKDFLGRVLAPTGDALGKSLAHPIVEWQKRRVEAASRLVEDAASVVAESGQEPQPVPGRLLIPILEKGSLEEDTDLRGRWVSLLANASLYPTDTLPSFVSILGELSPLEARLLARLAEVDAMCEPVQPRLRVARTRSDTRTRRDLDHENELDRLTITCQIASESDARILIANLIRLSLVVKDSDSQLRLTAFGEAFITACSRQHGAGR